MSAGHTPGPHVLRNPLNGLIWAKHLRRPVSETSGEYTVYATAAHAALALRRNRELLNAGFIVEPEPAHFHGYAVKLRVFAAEYGRLGGDCNDPVWNAWSAGWDLRAKQRDEAMARIASAPETAAERDRLRAELAALNRTRSIPVRDLMLKYDELRNAFDHELVMAGIGTMESFTSAAEALTSLINWYVMAAPDPAVSSDAQAAKPGLLAAALAEQIAENERLQARNAELEAALREIAHMHIPDMPPAWNDEAGWNARQFDNLRAMANAAIANATKEGV